MTAVKAGHPGTVGRARVAAPAARLVDAIDALLPQTQCTRCGYAACRPYARAVAAGEARINRCPPGGASTIRALAALLGIPPLPLDPDCGVEQAPLVARIVEPWCIGCTLCIAACPVDAIVGARKLMHGVLAGECTGCELCVAPCPMDCIEMRPAPDPHWSAERAAHARRRYESRRERLAGVARKASRRGARRRAALRRATDDEKRASIEQALARVRQRREKGPGLFFPAAGGNACRGHKK